MSLAEDVAAVRHAVALSRLDHVHHFRIRGDGAYDALDRLLPSALRIRDGQLLHTLLLTEDAHPFAEAYLCWDDEEFVLLAEGPTAEAIAGHLRRHLEGPGVEVEDRGRSHAILGLDGPYAWELLGNVVEPEVIGLPYLTFYHPGDAICYRAGKTGEFGYGVILPRERMADFERHVRAEGEAFDLREVGLDALDQCALENWFFNIRREGREPVTPIELQLQWRVSRRKEFVGSDALRRRREEGARSRLTCLLADGPVSVGDAVLLDGGSVGRIVNAGFSDSRGEWVALALLDVAWAYPGIEAFTVHGGGATVAARSVSPPVLVNRSLGVSPQLHSYATRHEYASAPLVRR